MNVKRRRSSAISNAFLMPSKLDSDSAISDLRTNGYFWLESAVPPELCERCAVAIQEDIGAMLDEGSTHQEEPFERLKESTAAVMLELRTHVLEKVLHKSLGLNASVPKSWSDTLYGRVKRKHFHTKWHCDAFNTLFQRKLLSQENLEARQVAHPEWERFRESGKLSTTWEDIPIFTFWVALRPVQSSSTSHLRIYPKSHTLPGIELRPALKNVVPAGFRYSSSKFLGPEFPPGYGVGDIVVFHCLTQHEANTHRTCDSLIEKGRGERISLDGRFFLMLKPTPDTTVDVGEVTVNAPRRDQRKRRESKDTQARTPGPLIKRKRS